MKLSKNATQHAGLIVSSTMRAPGPQLVERERQHLGQIRRLEMLDHLHRDQAAERFIGNALQVTARIGVGHVKPAGAADFDHLGIQIEPARANASARCSSSRNSPRPQPTSSTSDWPAKYGT